MFHRFHDRFGTAGVVLGVIALIAALGGSALAAGGLTKQQEKQVTKIAKKYAGKAGAPGAPGTNGTNGKDGINGGKGEKGDQGDPGTDGKNVVTGTATSTPAGECPTVGGATVEVQGEAATKKHVCNGSPWTAGGTLPPGSTETGAWGVSTLSAFGGLGTTGISFPIPLAAGGISAANTVGILLAGTPPPACDDGVAPLPSAANPEADPGKLCVYIGNAFFGPGSFSAIFKPSTNGTGGADPSGAQLRISSSAGNDLIGGTFAVTACGAGFPCPAP